MYTFKWIYGDTSVAGNFSLNRKVEENGIQTAEGKYSRSLRQLDLDLAAPKPASE